VVVAANLTLIGMALALSQAIVGEKTQRNAHADTQLLGSVSHDGDDPTVALRMDGREGLLIRTRTIWLSRDGGHAWARVAEASNDHGPASFDTAWARSVADVFVVNGSSIYETKNSGRTWSEKKPNPRSSGDFLAIAGNETGASLALAGSRSVPISSTKLSSLPKYANDVSSTSQSPRMLIPAIMMSHDLGKTWGLVSLPAGLGPLDSIAVSGDFAVSLGPYAIFTSSDGGVSWSAPDVSPSDGEEAYPLAAAIFGNHFWVSLKNGTLLTGSVSKRGVLAISKSSTPLSGLEFTSSCVGFALRADQLVTTEDGGATWQQVTTPGNVVALSATKSRVIIATHDQILEIDVQSGTGSDTCGR
jgi:photosystem II stability/assembly factor-like uncharacterized protein